MTVAPTQASLDALFSSVTCVRVLEGGASDGRPLGREVLAEARGSDVLAIREHLRIQENGRDFYCMCYGDLAVELLVEERRVMTLGFHHCVSLRHPEWNSDAMLVDGPALARWLASCGVLGPLREHEAALEQDRRFDAARRVWLAAAPPCFAEDLPRFEDGAEAMPFEQRFDAAEQRVRASYATPEVAAEALLVWLGTGMGPWSGYPSYESLAEELLMRLGLPIARAVASSPHASDSVLRGAARLLSSFPVVSNEQHELGDVPEALWAKLRPIVQAMSLADNLAQFESAVALAAEVRRFRARPTPVAAGAALTVVGISRNAPLSGLVTDGRLLYSGEGPDIMVFDPASSSTPRVLFHGTDPCFELAPPFSMMLFVAHANAGTISKILTDGDGRLIVMAQSQARPIELVGGRGVLAWVNQAMVPDPQRGVPFMVQRSSIMSFAVPEPQVLRETSGHTPSLTADEAHLYWCESKDQGLEIWRVSHRRSGRASCFAVLGEHPPSATWFPRLAVNATHVVWANPDRGAILGVDKRAGGEPVVLAETRHPPVHVVVDDYDLVALTGDVDVHEWHVEIAPAHGGVSSVVAQCHRPLEDRPALVLTPHSLYFTTNDRILGLARAKPA